MNIILGIISLLVILYTIIFYLRLKKEVNTNKKMSDDYFVNMINRFRILTIISILLGVISFGYNVYITLNKVYEDNDINKYEEYISNLRNDSSVNSDLLIFPDKVDKNKVKEFKNYNKNFIVNSSYFILLKYEYNEEEFNIELNRLKYYSKEEINKDGSELYIVSNNEDSKEYIIIENNIITYVYNQSFNKSDLNINGTIFDIIDKK